MSTYKTHIIRNALLNKGFQISERHHEMYRLHIGGKKTSIRTRLSHGSAECDDGLLGLMAGQLKLRRRELNSLIDCPMSGEDYLGILLQRGYLKLPN